MFILFLQNQITEILKGGTPVNFAFQMAEQGMIPDFIESYGIKKLLETRLLEIEQEGGAEADKVIVPKLLQSPIAISTEKANQQHYEVPAPFYEMVLGKNLKYSCGYWERGATNLDESEDHMLQLTCERAEIKDGMEILDLGCGWGSLTLWIARQYPNCKIHSVSNSAGQKAFIDKRCQELGLNNVTVLTADMNEYSAAQAYDRILSIEMFEHMRNYQKLLSKISTWLKEDGKLFVHIFCHKKASYFFETEGKNNWMARNFFTGGIMPSKDLLFNFQDDLKIETSWVIDGQNYEKTCRAWIDKLYRNRKQVEQLFANVYGNDQKKNWFHRWRLFFLACAELFGFDSGKEWYVSHYLFKKSR